MKKMIVPNEILLAEADDLLSKGIEVVLMTKGNSMLPFIRGEKDSVNLKRFGAVEVGDIVLARIAPQRYVLHRIFAIDGDVLPSGTCAEIGKFHEKIARGDDKVIIGICTDNRQCALTHSEAKDRGGASSLGEQQYSYQNLYVTGLIKDAGVLVSNIDDVIRAIRAWV